MHAFLYYSSAYEFTNYFLAWIMCALAYEEGTEMRGMRIKKQRVHTKTRRKRRRRRRGGGSSTAGERRGDGRV